MKRMFKSVTVCMVFAAVGLASCNKEVKDKDRYSSAEEITGTWKLIEALADPGDGSGTYQPVTSDKIIQVYSDSSFVSNGNMCTMNSDTTGSASGFFIDTENINLTPGSCWGGFPLSYEHNGNQLIIRYNCIEGCSQKYVKL